MRLGSQRYKILQIPIRQGPLSFWLAFPNELCVFSYYNINKIYNKKNSEKQQFQDKGTNEQYILYFNLNGGKKNIVRQTSSCQDKSRCSKMCKITKAK